VTGRPSLARLGPRSLARFRGAQSVLDAAGSEPDRDVYDRLLDAKADAFSTLLALPAPDLPTLAVKACPERSRRIDAIVPEQGWALSGCEDCLITLRLDAHRLAASVG